MGHGTAGTHGLLASLAYARRSLSIVHEPLGLLAPSTFKSMADVRIMYQGFGRQRQQSFIESIPSRTPHAIGPGRWLVRNGASRKTFGDGLDHEALISAFEVKRHPRFL